MSLVSTGPRVYSILIKAPPGEADEELKSCPRSKADADPFCRRFNKSMRADGLPYRAVKRLIEPDAEEGGAN